MVVVKREDCRECSYQLATCISRSPDTHARNERADLSCLPFPSLGQAGRKISSSSSAAEPEIDGSILLLRSRDGQFSWGACQRWGRSLDSLSRRQLRVQRVPKCLER